MLSAVAMVPPRVFLQQKDCAHMSTLTCINDDREFPAGMHEVCRA